MNYIIMLPVG